MLAWAAKALGFDLSQASYLQGVVAVGIALGAVVAARYVSLRRSVDVLPIGIAMGVVVISMIFVTSLPVAAFLMIAIGACAGFFVVPMNALLQHRGHVLMGAGHSIAVQNFNENIGILVMVGLYALMVSAGIGDQRSDRDVRRVRLRRDGARDAAPPRATRRAAIRCTSSAMDQRRPAATEHGVAPTEHDGPVGQLVRAGCPAARGSAAPAAR